MNENISIDKIMDLAHRMNEILKYFEQWDYEEVTDGYVADLMIKEPLTTIEYLIDNIESMID